METQSLQGKDGGFWGPNSERSQEALGDAFGEQLASRINQAAGGDLDATGGSYFSAGLKHSQAVLGGTLKANQVGTATVDHRQLYVDEARAILEHAPAYAKNHDISETQAKKELIQQALLMVDRDWAEQTHITENAQARQALEAIAAEQDDKARDALTRSPFNQVVHQNESEYFYADEAAYNDTNLNATEASAIEAGLAGEDKVLTRYATANGEKPLEVAFSDSASRLGANVSQKAETFYEAVTSDPLGSAATWAKGLYEDTVNCLTTSQCIAPDQTHGKAQDRQLVAELQGNGDAAVAEAAGSLGVTLDKLTDIPAVGRVAKSGVVGFADTVEEQALKNAKDWAENSQTAKPSSAANVSSGPDVDGEMIGLDGPTYSGVRSSSGGVRKGTTLTYDAVSKHWVSPAGLIYGQGSKHGNRVKHVLDHATSSPNKKKHSVFSVDRKEVLGLVDEGWNNRGDPEVDDPGVFVVPMRRSIGTAGEENIKIVVRPGTSEVITAFPVN